LSRNTLPPESARVLAYVAAQTADLIAKTESVLGVTLPPEARARLVNHALLYETAEASRQLRALNLYCPN
jgi:cell wall assembly regulator SMI1